MSSGVKHELYVENEMRSEANFEGIVGQSSALREVLQLVERVATAARLGLKRTTLIARMKKLGIHGRQMLDAHRYAAVEPCPGTQEQSQRLAAIFGSTAGASGSMLEAWITQRQEYC